MSSGAAAAAAADAFKAMMSTHSDVLNEFLCDTFCVDKVDIGDVELVESDINMCRSIFRLQYWHSDTKKYLFYYDSSHPDLFSLSINLSQKN